MSPLLQNRMRPGAVKSLASTPGSDWLSQPNTYGEFTETPAMQPLTTPVNDPTGYNASKLPSGPSIGGKWMEGAGLGLQAANIGLGIYSALEQSKMNKFMKGYYGNEMARNKVDFNNNVTSTNAALEAQARTRASASGFAFGTPENNAAVTNTMDKWGVQKFE